MRLPSNRIVIATKNRGKAAEFAHAFAQLQIEALSLLDMPAVPDVEETGETFAENALLKAQTIAGLLGIPVMADDSGLCVEALNGAPGIYSARYAGAGAADADNNLKLLEQLRSSEDGVRTASASLIEKIEGQAVGEDSPVYLSKAKFVCVLALFDPLERQVVYASGEVQGRIIGQPRGSNGFGYDPLFYVPKLGRTLAELSVAEKQQLSHRGLALAELIKRIGG